MEKAEAEMARAVPRFSLRVDVTPSDALLEELQWTAGNVAWLRDKVAEVVDLQLVSGVTRIVTRNGVEVGREVAPQVSLWYELWMRERKHLVAVAATAARCGVEQRQIELAEAQGELVAGALHRILSSLLSGMLERGVDPRDFWDDMVATVVPREFRALASAP